VIIAKKNANIKTSHDLKGKSVLAFKFKKSAAGYVFQVKHLMDQGIDPFKDFRSFTESKNQDDIVFAVKNGLADVGFIKTGLLEVMEKEGKVKKAEFEIVDQVNDNFAHVHSTRLYPEWTVVYSAKAAPNFTGKLKSALLNLKSDDAASKKARIAGFVEPLSFDELDNTMRALKLGPYNK
jgi:two-component system sensor histidine kinase TtrS